ncbi:hypothetical protein L1049_005785 [Liquidambar formosana]|uniref:Uncharacterized protein n=1 Tax=Liquidambar formosana TaxID=63359 RepID=A0AAP0REV0_LIQFO
MGGLSTISKKSSSRTTSQWHRSRSPNSCECQDVAPNSRNKDSLEFHGRGSPKDYRRDVASHDGDVPRRSREERGLFVYWQDGEFNSNSKSFRMRECDEDVAPRRRRPS